MRFVLGLSSKSSPCCGESVRINQSVENNVMYSLSVSGSFIEFLHLVLYLKAKYFSAFL